MTAPVKMQCPIAFFVSWYDPIPRWRDKRERKWSDWPSNTENNWEQSKGNFARQTLRWHIMFVKVSISSQFAGNDRAGEEEHERLAEQGGGEAGVAPEERQGADGRRARGSHSKFTGLLSIVWPVSHLANISPIYYSTFRQSVDNWRTQWREASWQWESWRGAAPLLMRCVPHTYSFCPSWVKSLDIALPFALDFFWSKCSATGLHFTGWRRVQNPCWCNWPVQETYHQIC